MAAKLRALIALKEEVIPENTNGIRGQQKCRRVHEIGRLPERFSVERDLATGLEGRGLHVENENVLRACYRLRVHKPSLEAAPDDYHAVLVNGDSAVRLTASRLHLSSDLHVSELVGRRVKVINCPQHLVRLINASVDEDLVLVVSQRVV